MVSSSRAPSPPRASPCRAQIMRLSAGREIMSTKAQALAFLAGTNSIFVGDRLLSTANRGLYRDAAMFETLGLVAAPSPSA
jgi:biotin synthase-like enzyme